MFTVLIQNEKTMDSFYEHLPLFNGFLNEEERNRQMDVCLWNEEGKTIEEALPDLHALTDHKSSWRAVIVRYEDDRPLASHPKTEDNPYDFLENAQGVQNPDRLSNPLIRLVSMLSKPLEYFDKNRARSGQSAGAASASLVRDLETGSFPRYDGVLPDSIVLVTLRRIDPLLAVPDAVEKLDHPDFVERNGYSSLCRFAVVDRISQGKYKRIRDDFSFWSIVLMLAFSPVDSSIMRAYQLYSISARMDEERMVSLLSNKQTELRLAAKQIDHFLEHQSIYLEKYEGEYPDYQTRMEPLDLSKEDLEPSIRIKPWLALPENPSDQQKEWDLQVKQKEQEIESMWNRLPAQVQEQTPALARRNGYLPEEADVLSPLQEQRLTSEISELQIRIVKEQAALPELEYQPDPALEEASRSISNAFKERMSKGQLIKWMIALCLLALVCAMPAWMRVVKRNGRDWVWVMILTIVLFSVPLITAWLQVRDDRRRLSVEIRRWSHLMSSQMDKLRSYMEQYTKYLSDVLSYRNAASYLEQANRLSVLKKEEQRSLEQIRHHIGTFMARIKVWADAMGIELSYTPDEQEVLGLEELQDPEIQNRLFEFEPDHASFCEINETGRKAASPFSFIVRMSVKQLRERKRV